MPSNQGSDGKVVSGRADMAATLEPLLRKRQSLPAPQTDAEALLLPGSVKTQNSKGDDNHERTAESSTSSARDQFFEGRSATPFGLDLRNSA